jgi:polysaccharide pyruvyl transferase CsaB
VRRSLRILILGYYGFANAGDEIVLAGILRGIEREGRGEPWEVRALSADPARTLTLHSIRAYARFSPADILSALLWCDVLVLGGGSLIQDVTSRRSAVYYLWICRVALALRRRLFLWAQGFGPLEDPRLRESASRILSRASGVTLRDPRSLTELVGLGLPESLLTLSADPAFLLDDAGQEPDGGDPAAPGALAVALRPWGSVERSCPDVAAACDAFARETAVRSLFVPFHLPGDVEISRRVLEHAQEPHSLLTAELGPSQMVRLFRGFHLSLGMRLHSIILSAMAGVPFAGLSYDPKIERFCHLAGMPCLTADGLHAGELQDLLLSLHANREQASSHLRRVAQEQRELARVSARVFRETCAGAQAHPR